MVAADQSDQSGYLGTEFCDASLFDLGGYLVFEVGDVSDAINTYFDPTTCVIAAYAYGRTPSFCLEYTGGKDYLGLFGSLSSCSAVTIVADTCTPSP